MATTARDPRDGRRSVGERWGSLSTGSKAAVVFTVVFLLVLGLAAGGSAVLGTATSDQEEVMLELDPPRDDELGKDLPEGLQPREGAPGGEMPGVPEGEQQGPGGGMADGQLTDDEREWLIGLGRAFEPLGLSLEQLAITLSQPAQVELMLAGDEQVVQRVESQLDVLRRCSTLLSQAGREPSGRLEVVHSSFSRACDQYERGADHMSRAMQKGDPALIERAGESWEQATGDIEHGAAVIERLETAPYA